MLQFPFNMDATSNVGFREGRFIYPFIAEFSHALGVHLPRSFTMSALWMMLCLSVTAVLITKAWNISSTLLSSLIVAVIVLHPYQADIYTWKVALFIGGLPFVLATLSVLWAKQGWKGALYAGPLLLWVALGVQQLCLSWAAATAVFVPLLSICTQKQHADLSKKVWTEATRILLALGLGVAFYWLTAALVMHCLQAPSLLGREQIILFSNPQVVWERLQALAIKLFTADPLINVLQNTIILMLVLLVLAQILRGLFRNGEPLQALVLAILVLLSIALGWLATVALTVLPSVWIPVFRNMSSMGIVVAAIVAAAYLMSSGVVRKLVVAASLILCFGFAGKSNEILTDHLRANQRDQTLINRIAYDVEKLEQFDTIRRLYFAGKTALPLSRIHTQVDPMKDVRGYGVTMSVLANRAYDNVYQVMLFNELTGYFFGSQLSGDEQSEVIAVASTMPVWPRAGSVSVLGDIAIIRLGEMADSTNK